MSKRIKNIDGDAFIQDEPLVYGPMTKEPKFWLAWALETTQQCNGPRDSRPQHRLLEAAGSIRIRDEAGNETDTDCDNVTPVRKVLEDALDDDQLLRTILSSPTPMLRDELCRGYYDLGVDLPACADFELPQEDVEFWVTTEQGFSVPLDERDKYKTLKKKLLR